MSTIRSTVKYAAALLGAASLLFTTASPASATTPYKDGTSWVECSGRWTIAQKTSGVVTMRVYGCSNGYVFTHVNSNNTAGKNAGIKRDNPFAERYSSTTGYSLYATTTNMLRYLGGTCYTATGSGYDYNIGQYRNLSYRWCR